MWTAIGRMAGPDRPPLPVPRIGRRLCTSMRIPSTVLMAVSASAPASSAARATATTSGAFGVSFKMIGISVEGRNTGGDAAGYAGSDTEGWPPLKYGKEVFY